jgi:hypothetical protein
LICWPTCPADSNPVARRGFADNSRYVNFDAASSGSAAPTCTAYPLAPAPFPREAAVLDQHAVAALIRWGRALDDRGAEEGL